MCGRVQAVAAGPVCLRRSPDHRHRPHGDRVGRGEPRRGPLGLVRRSVDVARLRHADGADPGHRLCHCPVGPGGPSDRQTGRQNHPAGDGLSGGAGGRRSPGPHQLGVGGPDRGSRTGAGAGGSAACTTRFWWPAPTSPPTPGWSVCRARSPSCSTPPEISSSRPASCQPPSRPPPPSGAPSTWR